ncbi:hypothetical protein L198_08125 [Cryptococcus wingfieldii CBS 7118]|uniref:Uncharacterized protein n=1 Tax=Cryptococcus wingfieldii CBS 7118 TaxID=1295528 RepID=A0A1E3HH43_9TREE|nr:hypothetical protein L198_08125 [Cryptococcus wingfieldii CBS 7118]ODN75668.1 hypothetical protein L198_08125 [Cryptococcus wingfieldii CBS 7118]
MNINLRLASGSASNGPQSNEGMAGLLSTESPNSPMRLALTPMKRPSIVHKAAVGELDRHAESKAAMRLLNDVDERRRQVKITQQFANNQLKEVSKENDEREQEARAMLHKVPWPEDLQFVASAPAIASSSKHNVG